MCQQTEYLYKIIIVFSNKFDDFKFEIPSEDFTEPNQEDIQDIATTKHLMYYLTELFGEILYECIDQDYIDEIEEMEINEIKEVQIIDTVAGITYYINLEQKVIDIENN